MLGSNYKAKGRLVSAKVWLFARAFDKYTQIIDNFPFSLRKWMIYYNTPLLNHTVQCLDTRCQFITADSQPLYSIAAEKLYNINDDKHQRICYMAESEAAQHRML